MTTETILIADDEATVQEVVRKYLELEGFKVICAADGTGALSMIYQHKPDLLILDIMLPGLDGFTLIRTLRDPVDRAKQDDFAHIPVMMLTARTHEEDRITGFELGADDYVVKPFSPRELVMRVKAILRRSQHVETGTRDKIFAFGTVSIDPSSRTVDNDGKSISLTAKEFELLLFLVKNPRQVFTRAQLLDRVWGYDYFGDDSTVTVHIHRLREKLEKDPNAPQYIHTVWGVGYKFEEA